MVTEDTEADMAEVMPQWDMLGLRVAEVMLL